MSELIFDPRFQSPTIISIVGYSQSGKTELTCRIIRERARLFTQEFKHIIWLYREYQSVYDDLKRDVEGIVFTNDLNKIEKYSNTPEPTLLVMDDIVSDLLNNGKQLLPYYTQRSHHGQNTIITLTQSLFLKGCRLHQINSHYLIVFKLPRDSSSMLRLGYQLYPLKPKFVYESFLHSTRKPYAHFLIDSYPHSKEISRFRSTVFYWEDMILYRPNDEGAN